MGFRRSEMKKSKWAGTFLVLVLVLGLVAMLAACGGDETETTGTTGTETTGTETSATETTVAPVEDTGQTWNLKFSYGVPSASSLSVACLLPWAAAVEEATGGRVKIEHYADGTLAKDDQQYDFLLSGASDLSVIEPEYTAGTFNVFEMGSLPELFQDPAVASASMWDVANQYPDELDSVKVMGVTCIAGAQYIGNSPVKVPADMAGLKMRSGGKIESWILEALGAEPIDILLGDVGTALERGLADGGFFSWSLTFISGAVRYTTDRTELNLLYRPWLLCMNKDVWDSMPQSIQDQIMSVSGQEPFIVYAIANEMITDESKAGLEKADAKAGNPPIYVPTAEESALWTESVKPVWQKWVDELAGTNSPYADQGQDILDFVAAQSAQYSTVYEDNRAAAQAILDARFEK
jgi:TRAP-type C4-dicarboxylate transport system substrate-binding protein